MTTEQKSIKIAEACGWKWASKEPDELPAIVEGWLNPLTQNLHVDLPDYFQCLNAMHEAEKVLSDSETEQYNDLLGSYLWSGYPASRRNFHATAAQRAEAFGKTLNLW